MRKFKVTNESNLNFLDVKRKQLVTAKEEEGDKVSNELIKTSDEKCQNELENKNSPSGTHNDINNDEKVLDTSNFKKLKC